MTMPYSTYAVADLLDAFASNEPVPGGGSASALAGALGVSLLLMVSGIARTKTGAPEETVDLADAGAKLRLLRETLIELIDRDSEAYSGVLAAFRLPKATDSEKAKRLDEIQRAMRLATEAPMELMRLCQQSLRGAVIVAKNGNPNAASDVAVAIELLLAAARGAGRNVLTNLSGLKDGSYVERMRTEVAALGTDAEADADRARAFL